MATRLGRTAASTPLVQAARRSGIAFDASPTGRWIRLAGQAGVAYVVQDVWGDGRLGMKISEGGNSTPQNCLDIDLAV